MKIKPVFICFSIFGLTACGNSNFSGIYSDKSKETSIEFKSNNKAMVNIGGGQAELEYLVDGENLIFIKGYNDTLTAKIKKNGCIYFEFIGTDLCKVN